MLENLSLCILQNTVFVNSYAIIASIGKGSFGEVKLAMNTHDMEVYALKLISKTRRRRPKQLDGSPHTAEASVMSEINLMKELSHPNLVRLIEVIGVFSEAPYFTFVKYTGYSWYVVVCCHLGL